MNHIVQAASLRWYNACAYYALSLARGLDRIGQRVTVAGSADTPLMKKAEAHSLATLPLEQDGKGPAAFLQRMQACRRFALKNGVNLVNVHNGDDHLIWALALRGTGIPLLRTSGNQIAPKTHAGARVLMGKTASVIASCKPIRRFYSEGFGIDAAEIPVINGGVDNGYFIRDAVPGMNRSDFGIPGDAFLFGILARFSPDKGHEHFFRAAGTVAKEHPEAHFLVAGWNAQLTLADMERMARDSGITDRTVFTGRLPDSRGLISMLDAGIIASVRSETICRIAMEYMAMGVPVVASDTNVIPEVVPDGEAGYIVPAGNPGEMAAAMQRLVADRDLCRRLGANGVRHIEANLSLEAFAEQTLDHYAIILP